jgi:hypothetical protein
VIILDIKLTEYGLDDTLKYIKDRLETAIGKKISKEYKDNIIYETIGAINALYNVLQVTEVDSETKSESIT